MHAAACDFILWDILGKAVNRPIYKILGGTKDRVLAYASSQHLATVEDFGPDALKAKAAGFKAYKIHPGGGQRRSGGQIPAYLGHIEEIKEVRKAVGRRLHPAVRRRPALQLLRGACGSAARSTSTGTSPSRTRCRHTTSRDWLNCGKHLDVPTEVGEFIISIYDYGEYIRRGAMGIARLIADNLGGITGSFRVGQLADTFGMPCTPHNWGTFFDLAAGFQIGTGAAQLLLVRDAMAVGVRGPAVREAQVPDRRRRLRSWRPTEPGMGYPLDRAALDKIMTRIDR